MGVNGNFSTLLFFSLGVHKLTANFSLALYLVFYYFVVALFIGVCG